LHQFHTISGWSLTILMAVSELGEAILRQRFAPILPWSKLDYDFHSRLEFARN
jgi:hypothetical protein